MKCIKNKKTGNIIRVENQQAQQMVGMTWGYVAKAEWKLATRKPKVEEVEVVEETVSEKQLKRKKKGK